MNLSTKYMTPGLYTDIPRERESAAETWVLVVMILHFETGVHYLECRVSTYIDMVAECMVRTILNVRNFYMKGVEFKIIEKITKEERSIENHLKMHNKIKSLYQNSIDFPAYELDFKDAFNRYGYENMYDNLQELVHSFGIDPLRMSLT